MVRGRYGGLDVDTHQRTFCRDKPLHINCMGHILQGQYASWCVRSGLRHTNHIKRRERLGTILWRESLQEQYVRCDIVNWGHLLHEFKPAAEFREICRGDNTLSLLNIFFGKNRDVTLRKLSL